MSAGLSVAVYILNWNGRAYLPECLAGINRQEDTPDAIRLIDNGSDDDSVSFVRESFPNVVVQENGRNLGFSAGNNVALRNLKTDVAILLNPDVVLADDWIAKMIDVFRSGPDVGVAGCKLHYPDGRTIQHAGGYITHPQAMPGHYGIGEVDDGRHQQLREVDYVIGAAMALRREVVERIGLLDEGFFLYFEDTDYCYRARRAGFRVVYAPQAAAIHVESATTVKGSFRYNQQFHAGRWRFLLKHFPASEIIAETFPVELEWLGRLDPAERLALGTAYGRVRYDLDAIRAARERDGGEPFSDAAQAEIAAGLEELQRAAWRSPRPNLDPLWAEAEIRERPFRSSVPLVGPLIARIRSAWNRIEAKPGVDPLRQQQSRFNALLLQELAELESRLEQQTGMLRRHAEDQAGLQSRSQALSNDLIEVDRHADELHRRLPPDAP